jgi:hypothetical protein
VGGAASTSATVRDAFIREVCAPNFTRNVLNTAPVVAGKIAEATIRPVPNSAVLQVLVWGPDRDASLAASRLLSDAIIAAADPKGTRELRVAYISRPATRFE